MTAVIRVRVLLFAAYRELLGANELELDVPSGSTPSDVFRRLQDVAPRLETLLPYTTYAVNREVSSADLPLSSGDELAFLQPVSGGA